VPQAAPAVVAAAATTITVKAVVIAALKFLLSAAISYAIGRLTSPNLKKLNKPRLSGVQVLSRGALEYRKRVYGRGMVSGPVVYQNLTGSRGKYLWLVIALADHRCESLVQVRIDSTSVGFGFIDWDYDTFSPQSPASPAYTGEVTTFFRGGANTAGLHCWWMLGDDDQPALDALLDSGEPIEDDWTSAYRLRGITYLVTRMTYDKNTEKVWATGRPGNIRALLKGARLYDPRLDSTQIILTTYGAAATNEHKAWRGAVEPAETGASGNEVKLYRGAVEPSAAGGDTPSYTYGSGSHRTTDSSTWAWADNPSLAAADYLMNVMNVTAAKIDWESVATAADDCDELVLVSPAASPQNEEKRFTINGAVSMGESHKENLSVIQESMAGRIYWSQGRWFIRASVWKAPTVTLTENDLVGDIKVVGGAAKRDRFNLVRGFFVDQARDYQAVEFPHVTLASYLTRDNSEVIALDLRLPLVDSDTEAQRIAWRALRQSNNQKIIEIPVAGIAANLSVGDTINLNFPSMGWEALENLLPYSEDPSQWFANTQCTVTAQDALSPSGKKNAAKIEATNTAASCVERLTLSADAAGMTARLLIMGGSGDTEANRFAIQDTASPTNLATVEVDYSDGSITQSGAMPAKVELRARGAGWYELMIWIEDTTEFVSGDQVDLFACFDGLGNAAAEYAYVADCMLLPGVHRYPAYIYTDGASATKAIQTARITDWRFQPGGTFKLICAEDYEASYADPAITDYTDAGAGGLTDPGHNVPPPENLTATSVPNGIELNWDAPAAAMYDFIEVYESLSDNLTDSPEPALLAQMRGDQMFLARESGFTGYYWVRAVRLPDLYSDYFPSDSVSDVTATAGATTGANMTGGSFTYVSTAPTNAKAGYRVNGNTGQEEYFEGETSSPAPWTQIGSFMQQGSPSDIEVYMEDLATGNVVASGSAVDTWIVADTNPYWYVEQAVAASPNDFDTFNGLIRVRNRYTQVELDVTSATVTLRAQESGSGLIVEASASGIHLTKIGSTCYAGVQFNADGNEYRNANAGSQAFTSSRGAWLTAGAAGDVWVERTITDDDGTGLDWTDSGTGRLNLGTTRQFGLQTNSVFDNDYVDITFDFYDAVSGGNLLDSVSYTIRGEQETGS